MAEPSENDIVFGFHVTGENTSTGATAEKELSRSLSVSAELITHMEYMSEKFHQMKPHSAPMLPLSCTLLVDDHRKFGKTLSRKRDKITCKLEGLADTGAQICTAGSNLLTMLGLDETFLVPTTMEVKGITHCPVTMLGALFLEISSHGKVTNQVVYIASEARSLILSEKALKELGVIPEQFPAIPKQFPSHMMATP